MSKYIHSKLDHFLKIDSKKIKLLNPKLKKSEILNSMAQMFGWRHYNELVKNIDVKNNIEFVDIGGFEYKKLYDFKYNYCEKLYEMFPIKKEESYDDPYGIRDGLFFNLINKKKLIFKKGNGNILNVSLLRGLTHIKLTNEEIEKLIDGVLDRMHTSDAGSGMWLGRSSSAIHSIINSFKLDPNEFNWQDKLINCFSFNYLTNYWMDHEFKGHAKNVGLHQYIVNMPGFGEEYLKTGITSQCTTEQHGYIMMAFFIIRQSFLNVNESNVKTYTLDDFRNHDGSVIFEHYDKGDILIDLNLIKKLL
jgi:hypothetical protein